MTIITNLKLYKLIKKCHVEHSQNVFFILLFLFSSLAWSQQTNQAQDSVKTGFSLGEIKTPNPNSIESKYTFDPTTNNFNGIAAKNSFKNT